MDNPIHKVLTGNWAYSRGRARPGRGWAYSCSICKITKRSGAVYIYLNHPFGTRKQAKDGYYKHLREEHAGTGVYST